MSNELSNVSIPGVQAVSTVPTVGAATGTGSTLTVAGTVVLTIAGQQYTLTGTVGSAIIVEYHKPFDQAISIGSITSIAGEVGTALGVPQIGTQATSAVNSLSGVPVLGSVVAAIANANIRITDLAINTQTKTYQFGFAFDFTAGGSPPTLAGITLDAFGLLVSYTSTGS